VDLIYGHLLGVYYIFCSLWIHVLHRKNDFAQISKNLARYRSENNFVRTLKLRGAPKLIAKMSKLFKTLLIMLERPNIIFKSKIVLSL